MIGSIIEIKESIVYIKLNIDISVQPNLINYHVVFEDDKYPYVVGQIINTNKDIMSVSIVGEITEDGFISGNILRPSFKSLIRLIKIDELKKIFGNDDSVIGNVNFGLSNIYSGYKINVNINSFFNSNFSILGNTGSGKSSTVASILQKLFRSKYCPISANLFFFDAYGEYTNAFATLNKENNKINYKVITTNIESKYEEILRIPTWLLDVDDLALLLDVDNANQLPIIEKTLNLVTILTGRSPNIIKRKNDIIAKALQNILLSGAESTKIHDQVIAVLTKFNTSELSLNTKIIQPGYTRTLKQCLIVDRSGKMPEMELIVEFIRGFILEEDVYIDEKEKNVFYSLRDLEHALDFALIDEGILTSNKVFDYANVIAVRLHSLVNSVNSTYFEYNDYVDNDQYIEKLMLNDNGNKCQIINFNINYIDDRLAKVITKIISRKLFLKSSVLKPRGSRAFHIIIEEAHRYVQNDNDIKLLGYNIFERISKEGRKYGVFLGLISQRPSELSDTCISQCNNFLVLRTIHPKDIEYIKEMLPNINNEIVLQLKNLKPGNLIAFGSAFKIPTSMYIDMPNPITLSSNVDLVNVWYKEPVGNVGISYIDFDKIEQLKRNNEFTSKNFVSDINIENNNNM